jgi:hypothetical protein
MDVKQVIDLLSGQTDNTRYSEFLFGSTSEKYAALTALLSYILFFISNIFKYEVLALVFILLALTLLIIYGLLSFLSIKKSLKNPIKDYAQQLKENIDIEVEIVNKLTKCELNVLSQVKEIFEHESNRINERVIFLIGASEKVGIFPSIIAVSYAVYEFNVKSEFSLISYIVIGITIGLYMGVLFLKRVISWQKECIYLIGKALKVHSL